MSVLIFLCGMAIGIWCERHLNGGTLHIIENGRFTWRWERKP